MRFASVLAAAAIVVSCGSGALQAQSDAKLVPAEFPPASYGGRQYVDSKGCVFIRAGVNGAVTWVPRMTRSRQHVCGFKPTLSASALAAARAPRATAAPATTAKPATATAAAAPKPAAPAPAPKPASKVASATAYRTAPAPVPAPAKPAPPPDTATATVSKPKPAPRQVAIVPCTGASALSQQYLGTNRGYSVRCGPQSAPHVTERATAGPGATVYRPGPPPSTAQISAAYRRGTPAAAVVPAAPVRVAPRHVYEKQKASTEGVYVPRGYTTVWEDDRLNPYRAHHTLAGRAQTDRVWTRTTPRRLIPREAGPTVTRAAPAVAVSSRGTAPAADDRPASHRYVQLGAFTDPAHARRTAQRIANSGLPARMGGVTRNGKSYTLVLAGPFGTQAQLDRGLRQVRGMGFPQAVLRK